MKETSSTVFWLRHLGLALILVIIAVAVLTLRHSFITNPKPEGASAPKSLAKGMSDFYESYKLSSSRPFEDDIGDFVKELNPPETSLESRLESMESIQKPISGNWVGEHKYRTFKAGGTLRETIIQYAQSEGMQVIWELEQDFIVKHQFQLDDTIVGSLRKIAAAIDSNFEGEVKAFFCPKQRSLVITTELSQYLAQNCSQANS